ncbi:MAG: zf-HC2 domain-containing protein [Acidobacteriota bacterium]|nr:zf-HC2 domain-containing protein [Acidobacteriota bacterium]
MRPLSCLEVTNSAPGFALDILDPATRAQVAAHLLRCDDCRRRVTSMQSSAAELLDLNRGDGPPSGRRPESWSAGWGGESWSAGWGGEPDVPSDWAAPDDADWLEDSDGSTPAVRPVRRRLRTVLSVAAAALLVVGTTLGPELEQAASHPENPTVTARLMAAGSAVGTVALFTGAVEAIDVAVEGLSESGTMDILVVDRSGTATSVGQIEVSRNRGAWLGHPPVLLGSLTSLVLVDGQRREVASAALAT